MGVYCATLTIHCVLIDLPHGVRRSPPTSLLGVEVWDVEHVLYGCVSPNWKDQRLLDKEKGIVTPVDAIKARLLSGEIDDLYLEVQKLCGYLRRTISDVKNA